MLSRRRLLQSLSLLAFPAGIASLSGCRDSEEAGKTTIRYMAWGNPEQMLLERQIADEFEKKNPDIRVKLFMVPGSSYTDKLQLMLASKTAPDIMRVDHYLFPALARKDYFLPLEPFVAREKPGFLDDFVPTALEEGRWEGKLYGLNVLFGSVMIYYNKNLFKEAGLDDPYTLYKQGKWDWDRFTKTAEALTKRDASGRPVQFGTNMVGFPMYASVIWNFGGEITDPGITHVTMGENPDSVNSMQKYADLRWKQQVSPTPADAALSAYTFESGKIAMNWGWAGESPRYRKNIKAFDWDIAPVPFGPKREQTVVKGNQLVISRDSKHAEAAWEFVKFMTGQETELLLCGKLRRGVPTRRSVQRNPEYLASDQPPYNTDVFLESIRRGRTLPIDARYQEWSQEYNSALSPLFDINEQDAKTALTEASRRANAVLSGEEGF